MSANLQKRFYKNPDGIPPEPKLITIIPESKDFVEWQQRLNELDIQKEMIGCGYSQAVQFFQNKKPTQTAPVPEPKIKQHENMFYPDFGLYTNPFLLTDAGRERIAQDSDFEVSFKPIKTNAYKEVYMKTLSGADVLFLGEKGIGKSSLGELVKEDMKQRGKPIYTVIAPQSFVDFCQILFSEITRNCNLEEFNEIIKEHLIVNNYITPPQYIPRNLDNTQSTRFPLVCNRADCPRSKRCVLTDLEKNISLKELNRTYIPKNAVCPLYRWLIVELCDLQEIKGIFFLDLPDDIIKHNYIEYFQGLINGLRVRKTLIMMCTREQYDKLRKTEYFTRFPNQELKPLTTDELKQILLMRIQTVTDKEKEYPQVFCDEALNYIAVESRGNPRKAIQYSCRVLEVMLEKNRKDCVDITFVKSALEGRTPQVMSISDALESIVRQLRESKAGWVAGSVILQKLDEEYQVKTNAESLGWRLSGFRIEKKTTPLTQYWFGT